MSNVLAIDTETTGLDVNKGCKPFAVYTYDGENYKWWVWDVDPKTRQPVVPKSDKKEIIDYINSYKELAMHNYSFDLRMLESVGITFPWEKRLYDTGVMGHIVDSRRTQAVRGRLKDMGVIFLQYPKDDEKALQKAVVSARRKGKKLEWNLADDVKADYWMPRQLCDIFQCPEEWESICDEYGNGDVLRTWSLHQFFIQGIHVEDLHTPLTRERRLMPVIHDMMKRGITVDPKRIRSEIRKRTNRIAAAKTTMERIVDNSEFNPGSPTQLATALFDKLRFKPVKMNKTGPSTDKAVLSTLHSLAEKESRDGDPRLTFLDALMIYRKNSTGRGYLTEYDHERVNNRLYYSLKQTGTSTTRFSSQKPNAQNVGKGEDAVDEDGEPIVVDSLRAVFGPEEGRVWLAMDYSQLQLRIFAYESNEPSLIAAFDAGWDAHDFVAHKIYELGENEKPTKIQRRVGKAVNFGFIFGAQPEKIEATAGISGLWNTVTSMFPNAHQYMKSTKWRVRKDKYVTTKFGYRLYLPYREGRLAEHAGVNYIVQGDEGDIVKNAMIMNYEYLNGIKTAFDKGEEPFITLQVHDEIIYDFPIMDNRSIKYHAKKLKKNMEKAGSDLGMRTPVDVEIIRKTWDNGVHLDV